MEHLVNTYVRASVVFRVVLCLVILLILLNIPHIPLSAKTDVSPTDKVERISAPGVGFVAKRESSELEGCDLDVTVVFDTSGSMEFDTACYGCWVRLDPYDYNYPDNGVYHPLDFADVQSNMLCDPTVVSHEDSGYRYVFIEAEYYSHNNSTWDREYRTPGTGYWALQRSSANEVINNSTNVAINADGSCSTTIGSSSLDDCSAYVTHHPFVTWSSPTELFGRFYTLGDAQADVAPRLDYYFETDWDGTAYVWVRAQGGGIYSENLNHEDDCDELYWVLDGGTAQAISEYLNPIERSPAYGGATDYYWNWVRVASLPVTAGDSHVLKIWAGSSGVKIDKIAITDDPRPSGNLITGNWNDINALTCNGDRGLPATPGSARMEACDPCNPIYGQTVTPADCNAPTGLGYFPVADVTNRLEDDLFGDEEPIRTSQEMVKAFVRSIDPEFHQAGFVPFETYVPEEDEAPLSCLRMGGVGCYQYDPGAGYTTPLSYTNVLFAVEKVAAGGSTNTAEALSNGLEALGVSPADIDPTLAPNRTDWDDDCEYYPTTWDQGYSTNGNSSCGRSGVDGRILILLSDGAPTISFGGECDDPEWSDLYPNSNLSLYDCVIYYAMKARDNGVTLYTIGLGNGVNGDLLQAAADMGGGSYYAVPQPGGLDEALDSILEDIDNDLCQLSESNYINLPVILHNTEP